MSAVATEVTPARATDVLVTIGSGNKMHVAARDAVDLNARSGFIVAARCGRRGRKVRPQQQHVLPPNTVNRAYVCRDCLEFTRVSA